MQACGNIELGLVSLGSILGWFQSLFDVVQDLSRVGLGPIQGRLYHCLGGCLGAIWFWFKLYLGLVQDLHLVGVG